MPRELTTNLAMLERLAAPAGKDVLDVGCGSGGLARELAARGARVSGLEISEAQLGHARALGDGDGGGGDRPTYLVGSAEALPLPDDSQDVVLFMNSLHHVPEAAMLTALGQAARVLRPDGLVYVAEPMIEGQFYAMVKLVQDEDHVRAAAQATLHQAQRVGLRRETALEYEVGGRLTDLNALRWRIVSVDAARAERFDAHRDELAEAFQHLGTERDGGREFTQPVRAELLRPVGS
ncbi:MAG: class I SAM-dependent methyltransferase [Solirubrobacteraceae bacterium]